MTPLKFRAKKHYNGEWIYFELNGARRDQYDYLPIVLLDTICQATGITDKNGKEIYNGDIIEVNEPVRETQVHVGDNIPLGYYEEPLEPEINRNTYEVVFENGAFSIDDEGFDDIKTPLSFLKIRWNECTEKELIEAFGGLYKLWDEDLLYLYEEYHINSIDELKGFLGVKVIGDIYERKDESEKS